MRALLLAGLQLLFLPAVAQAQFLQLDITYTDGHIISGPLSADLTELPPSVSASFKLNGSAAGFYATGDVLASSLVFGDGAWNATDLEEFAATLLDTDGGGVAVTALSYSYAAKNSPTTNGRLAANFPLTIEGTDIASGLAFHYQYDTSSQTVTLVPEPCTALLLCLGALGVVAMRRLWR